MVLIGSIVSAAKFNIGDTVRVTANLNVRTGAGTGYPEITDPDYPGYAPTGTRGKILSGPSSANGYIWWKVDYGPGLYSGWSVEDYLEKVINQQPTCSLTANPKSGKAPLTVTFSMSAGDSDGSISAWVLDVNGDGNADYSGYGNPPSTKGHTYTTAGNYNAALMVSDNDGAYASDVETINVGSPNQPPSCSLSANPKSGKVPLTVTFSMSASDSDGSITTWVLDVGDGNSYSGSGNPPSTKSHTYTSQGNYDVVLAVSDNDDATDFASEKINVGPPTQLPSVSTSAPSNIDTTSATLNGNLDSTGGETCEVWFEYGLTASYGQTTVKRLKSSTGPFSEFISSLNSETSYHFKACASNSKGTFCGSDKEFNTSKPVNHPPNPPTNLLQFRSDLATEIPIGVAVEEGLVFLKANISDPDGDRLKLQIELRHVDDNFIQRFTQQSSLVNISRISVAAYGLTNGNYHWQARVVDEYGVASEWVSFGNNSELNTDFSVNINHLPVARFTYSPKYPEIEQEIIFNASSSYDPDGGLLSYRWDFGEGNNAEGMQSNHKYPQTGYYTVNLTVTDDEGSKDKHSINIGIFSTELENSIKDIVNDTDSLLKNVYKCAMDAAIATDYFNEELTKDENEAVISLIFEAFDFILFDENLFGVKKISTISIADQLKLEEVSEELVRLMNDEGWVIVDGMEGTLSEGMEAVAKDVKNRLTNNNFDYFNTFKDDLKIKKNNRTTRLNTLKNEVLADIDSLSQEEINLYREDTQKRSRGNLLLENIYCNKVLLPITLQDIKIEEGLDLKMILGKISLKVGLTSGAIALSGLGAPSLIVIGAKGAGKLVEILQNVAKLNTDSHTLMISSETLFDGFSSMDYMSRNTFQGLLNIKEGILPSPPNGKIVRIEHFAEGPWYGKKIFYNKPPLISEKLYSEVEIRNTGNVQAIYELFAVSLRPFSTGVVEYKLPFIIGTERVKIEPNQNKIIRVWYKKGYLEGFKPKDQCIWFHLLGENNGIYQLDLKTECFGTTKIVTNNANVSEEELEEAPIFAYPISLELDNSSEDNYTLHIYITNPFDFSIKADLSQNIPQILEIISINNSMNNTNLSWQLELEAEEKKEISINLKPKKKVGIIVIGGAELKIYDPVNDDWVEFQSNNVNISSYHNINILLTKGWNLISIPLNLTNISFYYLFNNTNFSIFGYNGLWFVPNEINNKLGYWVNTNATKDITLIGTEIEDRKINLNEGWNLIGSPHLIAICINESYLKNYTMFAYMNNSWLSYKANRPFNSLKTLKPAYGYWVKK